MDISTISVPQLALSFIPVAIVVLLMWRWGQGVNRSLYAIARMVLQLTLIGYVLVYIFQTDSGLANLLVGAGVTIWALFSFEALLGLLVEWRKGALEWE